MSKIRRKVTVEKGSSVSETSEKRKPSVFERLGPGASRRYRDDEDDPSDQAERCRIWMKTGASSYGSSSRFSHPPLHHRRDESSEDLRHKMKHRKGRSRDRQRSESFSPERRRSPEPRSSRRDKDLKESKIRSTVVVKTSQTTDSESESDRGIGGEFNERDLDFEQELTLVKRRQELQRELSKLQEEEYKERQDERENVTINIQKHERVLKAVPAVFQETSSSEESDLDRKQKGKAKPKEKSKHSKMPEHSPKKKSKDKKKAKVVASPPPVAVPKIKRRSPSPEERVKPAKRHSSSESLLRDPYKKEKYKDKAKYHTLPKQESPEPTRSKHSNSPDRKQKKQTLLSPKKTKSRTLSLSPEPKKAKKKSPAASKEKDSYEVKPRKFQEEKTYEKPRSEMPMSVDKYHGDGRGDKYAKVAAPAKKKDARYVDDRVVSRSTDRGRILEPSPPRDVRGGKVKDQYKSKHRHDDSESSTDRSRVKVEKPKPVLPPKRKYESSSSDSDSDSDSSDDSSSDSEYESPKKPASKKSVGSKESKHGSQGSKDRERWRDQGDREYDDRTKYSHDKRRGDDDRQHKIRSPEPRDVSSDRNRNEERRKDRRSLQKEDKNFDRTKVSHRKQPASPDEVHGRRGKDYEERGQRRKGSRSPDHHDRSLEQDASYSKKDRRDDRGRRVSPERSESGRDKYRQSSDQSSDDRGRMDDRSRGGNDDRTTRSDRGFDRRDERYREERGKKERSLEGNDRVDQGRERGADRVERSRERVERGSDRSTGVERIERGSERLDRNLDRSSDRIDRSERFERGSERDRGRDRSLERGRDRDRSIGRSEHGIDRSLDRGMERSSDRNSDRGARSYDSGRDRSIDQGRDRSLERDHGLDRGDRDANRSMDRNLDRGGERTVERGVDRNRDGRDDERSRGRDRSMDKRDDERTREPRGRDRNVDNRDKDDERRGSERNRERERDLRDRSVGDPRDRPNDQRPDRRNSPPRDFERGRRNGQSPVGWNDRDMFTRDQRKRPDDPRQRRPSPVPTARELLERERMEGLEMELQHCLPGDTPEGGWPFPPRRELLGDRGGRERFPVDDHFFKRTPEFPPEEDMPPLDDFPPSRGGRGRMPMGRFPHFRGNDRGRRGGWDPREGRGFRRRDDMEPDDRRFMDDRWNQERFGDFPGRGHPMPPEMMGRPPPEWEDRRPGDRFDDRRPPVMRPDDPRMRGDDRRMPPDRYDDRGPPPMLESPDDHYSDRRKRPHDSDRSISPAFKRKREGSPTDSTKSGRERNKPMRDESRDNEPGRPLDEETKFKTDRYMAELSKRKRSQSPDERERPAEEREKKRHRPDSKGTGSESHQGSGAFSDWSDDPDEVLNKDEKNKREKNGDEPKSGRHYRSSSLSSVGSRHSQKPDRKEKIKEPASPGIPAGEGDRPADADKNGDIKERNGSTVDPGIPVGDDDNEKGVDMEYDPISDDELDELIANEDGSGEQGEDGAKVKNAAIVDALDIDWASLVKDMRPKPPVCSSALKRFSPANVLARIGVSKAYAGEALMTRLKQKCQAMLDEDAKQEVVENGEVKTEVAVKTEPGEPSEENTEQTKDPIVKPTPKFEFLNDIAFKHAAEITKRKERANLMSNLGPYRRALCARRDLSIRRQLCKVEKAQDQPPIYNVQIDRDLVKLSAQLLKQAKQTSYKELMGTSITDLMQPPEPLR